MEYEYFIAYATNGEKGMGVANTVLVLGYPIESLKDIRRVETLLARATKEDCVIITNYRLLKENKA